MKLKLKVTRGPRLSAHMVLAPQNGFHIYEIMMPRLEIKPASFRLAVSNRPA